MKKISTRLALLMAAAAVVPLLGYGAVSIVSLRTGAQQAVILGNQNVALQVAEQIELYVTGSVRILRALAAELQQTGLERWQQDRILKNYVLEFAEFRELTLLDDNGNAIVSSRLGAPTVSVPGSEAVGVDGALMSQFALDNDLLPTAVFAVRLAGDVEGWLVGRLNLEAMWRMVDRIRVGEQGYALVVTNDGQLLAHGDPDEKSRVARGDNLREQGHPLVLQLTPEANAEPTAAAQYEDQRGDVLGVAARLPALGWTVLVEQPLTEAFAIPIRMQWQLAFAITVALLAMLGAGYVWGSRFIEPILKLTRGTRALAEGRLDERVAVESADEIGQLGVAFNNMADRLVELQEDVKKKERQAIFGRIAVGLVHDLQTPIQNVGNSCKLIVKMFDDLEYRDVFKRTVERDLAQLKRVLDDLRNVAKPAPLEKFPLDVNKALAELVESMQATAESAGLEIETELVFGPLYIEGDLFALNRVYRNLLMNAMQATPPRGRVVVRTFRQAERAVIEVADTGCGIPGERLGAIFDDFVTTKRRGLGLGLAISKKIVEQLGGTIAVASEVGLGSTFTLTFATTRARPSSRLAAV
ncbi:MAG: sensor histidine kinase [Acidobacteria bacterium]|nr:sensor histidine kinase [Acidobacteriota bacterium]